MVILDQAPSIGVNVPIPFKESSVQTASTNQPWISRFPLASLMLPSLKFRASIVAACAPARPVRIARISESNDPHLNLFSETITGLYRC